ncbi:unnamed protein product [Rotaria sordida]|uniref:Uncharacterized protein n=1 Tax=Rotaria sordida TaxID=392033 RepID=A0A814BZM6_9BILA|nr:unnamed protein product [Rotaria sordida]CAF0934101.1 unnamed protein product [Rotaria sordida]
MATPNTNDPLGHGLIEQRLDQIPPLLLGMLEDKLPAFSSSIIDAQSFIVTGIGSSEAHARYLTLLINLYTDRQALFIGFTGFIRLTTRFRSNQILILFSQGLSPNAQMIIKYGQEYFSHILLFTSMNDEQMRKKCPWIEKEKIETIQFPLNDEYTTLIRVIGPICGFLAAILFVQRFTNNHLIEKDSLQTILIRNPSSSSSLLPDYLILRQAMIEDDNQQFSRGPFHLILSSPLIDVCQNLLYKFVEGLYWSSPTVHDYLQFAHGPFQQLRSLTNRSTAIVCIVDSSNPLDVELEHRLRQMIDACNKQQQLVHVYTLYLSSPSIIYSIFELEMKFNRLIFEIMCKRQCQQIDWPGKGQDQPLYAFSG